MHQTRIQTSHNEKNEKYNMNRTTTWIRQQPEINYATPNQIIDQAPKRDSPSATKGPVLDGVFHILHRDNLPNIKNNSSNHLFFSAIIIIYILLCRISNQKLSPGCDSTTISQHFQIAEIKDKMNGIEIKLTVNLPVDLSAIQIHCSSIIPVSRH